MLIKMFRIRLDIKSKFNDIVNEYDLTFMQWEVLKVINISDKKELSISEIILELNSDKATISQVIKNLEKKKMIKIKTYDLDKRKKNISLTKKMKEKCQELKEIEEEFLKETFKVLSIEEKNELKRILNKMDGEIYES